MTTETQDTDNLKLSDNGVVEKSKPDLRFQTHKVTILDSWFKKPRIYPNTMIQAGQGTLSLFAIMPSGDPEDKNDYYLVALFPTHKIMIERCF